MGTTAVGPDASGMLDVGDGNRVHWETCGDPAGTPLVWVHGGPGMATTERWRDRLTAHGHRAVFFHQRGCGRSTPNAADPATDLSVNTTAHLVADMERLRAHLGIERWVVTGGSWGSTLGLAYAQAHPERVSAIVLLAVTTTRRREIDWLYSGLGRIFPEAAERFRAGVPAGTRREDVLTAYSRLMDDPDPAVRARAAHDWCAWEDAVLSHEDGPAEPFSGSTSAEQLALVRICAHYFSHGAWLDEGVLIREAGKLAGIPAVLIHGRVDLAGPLETAWELVKNWPDAELVVLEDSGHQSTAASDAALSRALRRFA
ncbi:prolyl aminopeptidase [Actinokineospora spheciospongiae]|uniref:prolyl aminopeptidase n=1 Tax=Actinokineospora spheciospongiae TaxID=909613 RepID=UPI000D8F5C81|nr:prolyl aminopeptidase [Actinokineospora spheciospongiae]PWW65666.1 proline iminopeptidase [Actinokineospora spheciospongiae]